jgi:AraC-like DNA-binding protein
MPRSINRDDFQHIDRAIGAMAKDFPDKGRTGEHSHPRGQLLHAVEGVMLARTRAGAWLVPPGFALWIPPGRPHNVEMRGKVSMRTIYLRQQEAALMADRCRVIRVAPLLREAILALVEEPLLYDEGGRGGHLAALVIDEIERAPTEMLELPLPADPKLIRVCEALIANPGDTRDLDGWAEFANLGRRSLTRGFHDETGLSLGAWRRRLRTLNALGRLEDGASVAETAHRLGYRSPSALTAMIRRERSARSP